MRMLRIDTDFRRMSMWTWNYRSEGFSSGYWGCLLVRISYSR
jgi:hypothetical protein